MGTATFLLVLALAASQATAVNILVPIGKELIYDYQSVVKAGILTGTSYGSLFILRGQLIVFGHDDMIECRLKNLTYTLHNGEVGVDTTIPLQEITVPYEVEDLMKPFRIQYDVEGKVVGIYTDMTELEYSKNIKRALATILQLDRRVTYGCKDVCSFVTMEDSIYGIDKVNYNVMVRDDRDVVVQKMLERTSTKQLYQHVITNIFRPHKIFHVEHPLVRDCQKKYVIGIYHGVPVIKKIVSEGGIYFTPFTTLADTQYLLVTQTLRLIDVTEITDRTFLKTPYFIKTLKYHIDHDYIKYGMIPDVRIVKDVKTIYPIIYTMLKEIVIKLDDNPILEIRPDIYKTQLINRLHDILIRLDVVAMKELYMLLCDKTVNRDVLEVFYQILPLVGTRASVVLIKDLIVERLVTEKIMLHFLHVFPFHVRVCTGKLLLEVEELLMLKKDFSRTVYRAAVLSFTTLIRRIRENIINTIMVTVIDDTDITFRTKKIDVICEKYLHYLINRLMTVTEYDLQQIYITGIFNTKLKMAGLILRKHLLDENIIHNLRINMMWTVGVTLTDTDDIYTVFWPILTNRVLHLEYRGLALYILLKTNPTTTRLLNLVWYMDTERNTELYNIYYTYLHTILRTTDVTKMDIKERVVKIIRLVRRPDIRARSGFFALDYKDPIHNFGCTFNTFMMVTDRSQYIKIITHGHLLGIPINYLKIVFRIEGLSIPLTEIIDINRLLVSKTSLFNMEEIVKLVTILKTGGVKIEVDILVQDQVIFCKYFDKTNIMDLWKIMSDFTLFTLMKEYLIKINYNIYTTIMLPTDMGTLGMLDVKIPTIRKHLIDVRHDVSGGKMVVDLDIRLRESIRTTYGLTMYNPIVNVWQGVRKVKLMDVVIPIRMGFQFDLHTRVFKIVFRRTNDIVKDTVGLRTYVTGFVFLTRDIIYHGRTIDYDVKTRDLVVVGRDNVKKEIAIVDDQDLNTGLNYQVLTVDCDRPFTHGMLRKLFKIRRTVIDKNYRTNMGYWYLVMMNMYDYLVIHPCEGTCGLVFRGLPSKVYPVGEMDLTFRFIPDVIITRDILLPGFKLDSRITYTVKTIDLTPLKTIDLTMYFDVNEGQTLSTMKMILTTMRRGHKDERIVIDGIKKWTGTDVTGQLKVIYGITGVTEEPIMLFTMHGGLLDSQTVGTEIKYGRCDLGVDYHPFKCFVSRTSLRRYDYDIKLTKRVPIVLRTLLNRILIDLKVRYDYDVIDTKDLIIPDDTIKVLVVYPLIGKVMDLKVLTTTEKFMVTNIPVRDIRWLGRGFDIGLTPMFLVLRNYDVNEILLKGITWLGHGMENTRISPMFPVLRKWGIVNTCKVTPFTLRRFITTKTTTLLEGWNMIIGEVTHKTGVFVKRLDVHDLLILKIVLKDTDLEIVPIGDGMYKFIHNGVVVPLNKIRTGMGHGLLDRYYYDRVVNDDVVRDKSFITDRVGDIFNIKKRGIYDDYWNKFDDKLDFIKYKKYGVYDKYDIFKDKYGKDVDYWMMYKDFLVKNKVPFTTKYFDMFKDRYLGNVDTTYKVPFVTDKLYDVDSTYKYGKDVDYWMMYKDFLVKHKIPFTTKYFDMFKDRYLGNVDTTYKVPFVTDKLYDVDSTYKYGKDVDYWMMYKDFLVKHKIPFTTKYFDMFKDRYLGNVDTTYKIPFVTDKFNTGFGMYDVDTKERVFDDKLYDVNSKEYLDIKYKPWMKKYTTTDKMYDVNSKEYVDYYKFKDMKHKTPWKRDIRMFDFDKTGVYDSKEYIDSTEHFTKSFDRLKYKMPWLTNKYTGFTKDNLFDVNSREIYGNTGFYDVGTKDKYWKTGDRYDYVKTPWVKTPIIDTFNSKEYLDVNVPYMKKYTTLKDKLYDVDYKKGLFDSKETFTSTGNTWKYMKPWTKTDTLKRTLYGDVDPILDVDYVKMPWMKKYYNKYYDTDTTTRFVDSMETPYIKKYDTLKKTIYDIDSKEHFNTLYDVDSKEYLYKDTLLTGKTPWKKLDTFMYTTGADTYLNKDVDYRFVDDIKTRRYMDDFVTRDKIFTGIDKYIRDSTCWGVHCLSRIVTGTYTFGGVTVDIVGRTIFITTPKMTIFLEYNGRDVLIDYVRMKDYVGMCFDMVY